VAASTANEPLCSICAKAHRRQSALSLERQAFGERKALSVKRRSAVRQQGRPREGSQCVAKLNCAVNGCAVGNNPAGEANPFRLDSVNHPAGQDQIKRPTKSDYARKSLRSAVNQRHTEAPLGAAEAGGFTDDAQVAPKRKLKPSGDAPALNCRDRRPAQGDYRYVPVEPDPRLNDPDLRARLLRGGVR
jgi:hypothetical protein